MKIPAVELECVPITMYLCSAITALSCCNATWYAMQFISYTESDQQTEQVGTFIRTMDAAPCHLSFQGAKGNEGFQMFIKAIQKGDTVVFLSMKGMFPSVETFLMFHTGWNRYSRCYLPSSLFFPMDEDTLFATINKENRAWRCTSRNACRNGTWAYGQKTLHGNEPVPIRSKDWRSHETYRL